MKIPIFALLKMLKSENVEKRLINIPRVARKIALTTF